MRLFKNIVDLWLARGLRILPVDKAKPELMWNEALPPQMRSLDKRTFNTLRWDTKEIMHKWRDVLQSWMEKCIVKTSNFLQIYRWDQCNSHKSIRCLHILILKICGKNQRLPTVENKNSLHKEEEKDWVPCPSRC